MEILTSDISSISPATRPTKGYTGSNDGFSQQLYEIMNRKQVSVDDARDDKNVVNKSHSSVDQLVGSTHMMNASGLSNISHVTSGMLNLYIAQEKKSEKSGRGRVVEAAVAV